MILTLVPTSLIRRASQELFSEFLRSIIEPLTLLLKNSHKMSPYGCPYPQQAAGADPCDSPAQHTPGRPCTHTPHGHDARMVHACPKHTAISSQMLTGAHTSTPMCPHIPFLHFPLLRSFTRVHTQISKYSKEFSSPHRNDQNHFSSLVTCQVL